MLKMFILDVFKNVQTTIFPTGNLIRTSRRPAVGNLPFKNRYNRNKGGNGLREETKEQDLEPEIIEEVTSAPAYKKNRNRGTNNQAQQQQRSSYK